MLILDLRALSAAEGVVGTLTGVPYLVLGWLGTLLPVLLFLPFVATLLGTGLPRNLETIFSVSILAISYINLFIMALSCITSATFMILLFSR
jgi:hypothetical protein